MSTDYDLIKKTLYLLQIGYTSIRARRSLYSVLGVDNIYGVVKKIWRAVDMGTDRLVLKEVFDSVVEVLSEYEIDVDRQLEILRSFEESGGRVVTYFDDAYPSRFREYKLLPPIAIYAMLNNVDIYDVFRSRKIVAVVGTRKPSIYGCKMAEKIGYMLADIGIDMVTGLASGIDECAVKGFLSNNNRGSVLIGVRPYIEPYPDSIPSSTRYVHSHKNIAILSENLYKYGDDLWLKQQLYLRNRIISYLSRAIVVVEARARHRNGVLRGGSMSFIKFGLNLGKHVYIWGSVSSDREITRGVMMYIDRGARLFTTNKELEKMIREEVL